MTIYTEDEYQLLFEELEIRYGPFVAQDLMDRIKAADQAAGAADVLTVKALSDAIEQIRPEVQDAVRQAKAARQALEPLGENVSSLEARRQARRVGRLFRLYRLLQASYRLLHAQAMAAYTAPPAPIRAPFRQPETQAA